MSRTGAGSADKPSRPKPIEGWNASQLCASGSPAGKPLRLVIFYASDPDTPFLDLVR